MTIATLTGSRAWLAAGWTMIHFLWVGGAFGLVAVIGWLMLRKAAPEVRYAFALIVLAAMAVSPVWIVRELVAVPEPVAVVDATPLPRLNVAIDEPGALPSASGSAMFLPILADRPEVESSTAQWLDVAAEALPWLWLVGTPLTFAMMALGLVGAERLRRRARQLDTEEPAIMARRLADAMGIVRPVAVAVCDRISAPILVGIVRPLILLPVAALNGWGPEQIEMALLHELAHVRRLDNLVNLGQRVVESLLFFHPAVWWVSGWVRREREHCCDRMVVARTGRARPYAELLAELASHHQRPGRAALAMAENPIVDRIRRILNPEDHLMPISRPVAVLAAVVLIGPAVLIAAQAEKPQSKAKPESARIEELIRRTQHGADLFMGVEDRVYAMIQIARVQAQSGDREAARRTFQQAEELGGTVSFDDATYSPHVLWTILFNEQQLGFKDEAKATIFSGSPRRRHTARVQGYRIATVRKPISTST